MAKSNLEFITTGFTQKQKNSSRKTSAAEALTWDTWVKHCKSEIKTNTDKYVRKTVFMESANPDEPYEVRVMLKNSNVPLNEDGITCVSAPTKAIGVERYKAIIESLASKTGDVSLSVVRYIEATKVRRGNLFLFDTSTLPSITDEGVSDV